jgi:hypothetical protein
MIKITLKPVITLCNNSIRYANYCKRFDDDSYGALVSGPFNEDFRSVQSSAVVKKRDAGQDPSTVAT